MGAEQNAFTSEPDVAWGQDASPWGAFDPSSRREPPIFELDLGAFGTTQGDMAGPAPKTDSDGPTIGGGGAEPTGTPGNGDEDEEGERSKEEKGKLAEAAEDILEFIKGVLGGAGGPGAGGAGPGYPGPSGGIGPGPVDGEPLPPTVSPVPREGGDDTPESDEPVEPGEEQAEDEEVDLLADEDDDDESEPREQSPNPWVKI